MPPDQPLNPLAEGRIAGAGPVQEGRPLGRVTLLQGLDEDGLLTHHARPSVGSGPRAPQPHAPSGRRVRTESGKFSMWGRRMVPLPTPVIPDLFSQPGAGVRPDLVGLAGRDPEQGGR